MEALKLFGVLLFSIVLSIILLIPKGIILIIKTLEGIFRVIRKLFEYFVQIVREELIKT